MTADVKTWASKFKSLTNNDETIPAMGRYYTCTFMFDMGERKVIVEMHDGKVKDINTDPQPLDAYDFALRASAQMARATGFGEWPNIDPVSPRQKSSMSLPSISVSRASRARLTNMAKGIGQSRIQCIGTPSRKLASLRSSAFLVRGRATA